MDFDLGPLQTYVEDSDVTEIMVVNGRDVWVENISGIQHVGELTPTQVAWCAERISRASQRRIDNLSPITDASLPDGSRACVVLAPIAINGTSIAIRKFPRKILPLAAFGSEECATIVRSLVRDRANVVISGATSSGKTSLLSSVSQHFLPHERVVCTEDTAELRFAHNHVVRLQTRTPNAEGRGEVNLQDLVRTSLRLRPDRLIVGEVRGAEAIDMLLALSSGHRGCWSTVHSVSARQTHQRLTSIVLRDSPQWSVEHVNELINNAIDAVIYVARSPQRRRRINSIIEISSGTQSVVFQAHD